MKTVKKDIRALSKEQLQEFFVEMGDKKFRGDQVYEWLWNKGIHSFEDMTNISKTYYIRSCCVLLYKCNTNVTKSRWQGSRLAPFKDQDCGNKNDIQGTQPRWPQQSSDMTLLVTAACLILQIIVRPCLNWQPESLNIIQWSIGCH